MDSNRKKILVIDDDEEIRDLINRTLSVSELYVLQASSGREGIKIAKEFKPDLILLDITMPGFDGFMTGKILKRNIDTNNIPIIFLTGNKTKEDLKKAIEAGGSDYILKPFSPKDLITRLRKIIELDEIKRSPKTGVEEKKIIQVTSIEEKQKLKSEGFSLRNFRKYDDVIVFTTSLASIVLENCHIYRVTLENIISDGIFKIVLDTSNIHTIDGAGLGLLLSLNDLLRSKGGELRITFPKKDINNRFSFIKLNDLFQSYNTTEEAVNSFYLHESHLEDMSENEFINVCISCTFVNSIGSQYCRYCGTNIGSGKDDKIFEMLRNLIMHKLVFDTNTSNIEKINLNRNIKVEEENISSEFNVELFLDNVMLSYKSIQTDSQNFKTKGQIAIEAPFLKDNILSIEPGIKARLIGTKAVTHAVFETEIVSMDKRKGMIAVQYTEDAKILHSQRNFSVVPKFPIPVSLIAPSFESSYNIINGNILEMCRIRMVVFSEENIPENQCLSINFELPNDQKINSPLCIAQKRQEKFMYDLDFVAIDEKERTKIIQYMYKRQIEMAGTQ